MATGWTIRIGYLSGYSFKGDIKQAWNELSACVATLRNAPQSLYDEAKAFGAPDDPEWEPLMDYCTVYAKHWLHGGPLNVTDEKDHPMKWDGHEYIHIMASGERCLKEHVARAFVRLVMAEMHRKGIEISVTVG